LNKSKTRFFLREASNLCLNNKKSTAGQGAVSDLFLFTTPYKKKTVPTVFKCFVEIQNSAIEVQAWCSGESCLTESPGRRFETASL